jgi:hypothetical protein
VGAGSSDAARERGMTASDPESVADLAMTFLSATRWLNANPDMDIQARVLVSCAIVSLHHARGHTTVESEQIPFRCSRCGAEPWEPCTSASGKPARPHSARWGPLHDATRIVHARLWGAHRGRFPM